MMDRFDILHLATEAVSRRNVSYGTPENCFARIAQYWSVVLNHPVTAAEVGRCMTALKWARSENDPANPDNYVDAAGYDACIGEVALAAVEERLERQRAEMVLADHALLNAK